MDPDSKETIRLDDGRELTIADILESSRRALEKLSGKVRELQPKADFYDAVTESDDVIEMSKVSKILNYPGMGRNNLFEFLRSQDVLRPGPWNNNEPYQKYVDRGYFKIVEQKVEISDGDYLISRKTVVTQKGMDFIRKLLDERS